MSTRYKLSDFDNIMGETTCYHCGEPFTPDSDVLLREKVAEVRAKVAEVYCLACGHVTLALAEERKGE